MATTVAEPVVAMAEGREGGRAVYTALERAVGRGLATLEVSTEAGPVTANLEAGPVMAEGKVATVEVELLERAVRGAVTAFQGVTAAPKVAEARTAAA